MKYRPKIGPGDFDTKTKKVIHFLEEGHKVKVTLMFRGREQSHPELGRKILDRVVEATSQVGRVETSARTEGRQMTMVLGPDKKAQAAAKAAAAEQSEPEAPAADTPSETSD
jgi:translation initiation factor IF-3